MNCDCISETCEQIKPKVIEKEMKPPKGAQLLSVGCKNQVLTLGGGKGSIKLDIPFRANWLLPNGRTKETTVHVLASYCPLCGKAVE
jgi:hypothetical protein